MKERCPVANEKTVPVMVRVTEKTKKQMVRVAKEKGVSLSQLLRIGLKLAMQSKDGGW